MTLGPTRRWTVLVTVTGLFHMAAGAQFVRAESADPAAGASASLAASAQPAGRSLPKSLNELVNEDPAACLDYATILFYKARDLMAEGKRDEAQAVFMEVGQALRAVLQRAESRPESVGRALVRSQAAFMLGDLSLYVFQDPAGAKTFYEQSLRDITDHAGARRALDRLAKAAEMGAQAPAAAGQKPQDQGPK